MRLNLTAMDHQPQSTSSGQPEHPGYKAVMGWVSDQEKRLKDLRRFDADDARDLEEELGNARSAAADLKQAHAQFLAAEAGLRRAEAEAAKFKKF